MRSRTKLGFGTSQSFEAKDRVGQPGDMPRVIFEGDGADHGEPGAVDHALGQFVEFILELVPPSLLICQGLAGDHDGAGGLPHVRMLLRSPGRRRFSSSG